VRTVDERLGLLDGITWLSAAMLVVGVALAAILAWRWRKTKKPRRHGFRIGGPLVLAGLAFYVASVGFGSVTHLLVTLLFGEEHAAASGYNVIVVDLFFIAVALVALWLLAEFGLFRRWLGETPDEAVKEINQSKKDRDTNAVAKSYFKTGGESWRQLSERRVTWIKGVARSRWLARGPRNVDLKLTVLVGLMSVLLVIHVATTGGDFRFWTWQETAISPAFGWDEGRWIHRFASWAITLFLFPGIQILRATAFSREKRRQGVGKVWDVLSFWPRRFHPLAAPCYAERAVPELRHRIKALLKQGNGVLISAHSQGTVIALAALLQIKGENENQIVGAQEVETRACRVSIKRKLQQDHISEAAQSILILREHRLKKVAMVTYGSPLGRLYAPFFPTEFGQPGRLRGLREKLLPLDAPIGAGARGWQSLYRLTDYIGQQIFIPPGGEITAAENERTDVEIKEATDALRKWNTHSDYELEAEYQKSIDSLIEGLQQMPG
jgi:hypothetical protein